MAVRPQPLLAVELSLLGLLALLWGSSYLLIKIAVAEIPPVTLIAMRVAMAAVLLMAVVHWQQLQLPRDGQTWRQLGVQAFFNSIGAWTILAWGQQFINSGLAGVLNSTAPIFVFLFTAFLTRHEPVNTRKFAGACLGLTGVVLIIGTDVLAGLGQQVAGQLAALAGAVLYACAAIYAHRFSHLPATVTAACTMIWASACLIPLSLAVDQPWTLAPSPRAWAAALALGILCTALALLLYFRLVKTLGSLGVASQAYLRAGVGVLLGMVFLGETLTIVIGLGLIVAIAGVALINISGRRTRTG